jgi:hypothetical protein
VRSKGSSNKSMGKTTTNKSNEDRKEELKDIPSEETNKKTNRTVNAKDSNHEKIKENILENGDKVILDRKKEPVQTTNDTSKTHKKPFEYVSDSKKNVPYLSKNNLEKHNRLVQGAWKNKENEKENDELSKELKRHHELTPLDKDLLLKKAKARLTDRKAEHAKKQLRKKHRIIQRSSDFIFLKSKADSYKTIFEKKQKYAEISHREEQLNLRKTQSSDDIWKKKIADEVFQTFKEEREKLTKQKQLDDGETALSTKHNIENTDDQGNKRYFTRNTNDRYKSKPHTDDVNERFESFNRTNVNEINHGDKSHLKINTSRSEHQKGLQKVNKKRRERYLNDIDREDQYMMDMDFLAKEFEEKLNEKKLTSTDEGMSSERDRLQDRRPSNSRNSGPMTSDRFPELKSPDKDVNSEENFQLSSTPKSHLKPYHGTLKIDQDEEEMDTHKTSKSKNIRQDINSGDISKSLISPEKFDDDIAMTNGFAAESLHAATNYDKHFDAEHDKKKQASYEEISRKRAKKLSTNKEKGLQNSSFISNYKQRNEQRTGRAHFIQSYKSTPRHSDEIPKVTKTIEWKSSKKVDKELLDRFNEQRRARNTPKADEVTIRDKLKLEINVVDKKIDNSEQIEREKRKIKRFWQAVDGDEVRDEKEMFGDIDEKEEKMLVAKVTKERKMSSKSKTSRLSKGSLITHTVGDFNVTLEVAN